MSLPVARTKRRQIRSIFDVLCSTTCAILNHPHVFLFSVGPLFSVHPRDIPTRCPTLQGTRRAAACLPFAPPRNRPRLLPFSEERTHGLLVLLLPPLDTGRPAALSPAAGRYPRQGIWLVTWSFWASLRGVGVMAVVLGVGTAVARFGVVLCVLRFCPLVCTLVGLAFHETASEILSCPTSTPSHSTEVPFTAMLFSIQRRPAVPRTSVSRELRVCIAMPHHQLGVPCVAILTYSRSSILVHPQCSPRFVEPPAPSDSLHDILLTPEPLPSLVATPLALSRPSHLECFLRPLKGWTGGAGMGGGREVGGGGVPVVLVAEDVSKLETALDVVDKHGYVNTSEVC